MHQLFAAGKAISTFNLDTFNQTYENYMFMFMWSNRENFVAGFEGFCDTLTQRNYEFLDERLYIMNGCMGFVTAILLCYMIFYMVVIFKLLRSKNRMVQLFHHLPKNEIGKLVKFMKFNNVRKGVS